MIVDLRGASFDEFVECVFDHPAVDDRHSWFYDADAACGIAWDAPLQIEHLTRLFDDPAQAVGHLDPAQIELGFWFIASAEPEGFIEQLWNPAVPLSDRTTCARLIPRVYSNLFIPRSLDDITWMFGDFLVKDVCDFKTRQRFAATDVHGMCDVFLDVFERVLSLPDERAWYGALHGLGHLRHEAGDAVVRRFLAREPAISDKLRSYAEDVIRGARIL
jgi:hypothetical protein